jgi:hypothetical protein
LERIDEARDFVRSLGLKSRAEWQAYRKSGEKPDDIPTNPNIKYAEEGWSGMGDWLGTGTLAPQLRQYRSFPKARAYVRRLGLKGRSAWRAYMNSGKKPADLPAAPDRIYATEGWLSWGDWLGTGTIAPQLRQYRSFKKARAFVRGLKLKSQTEWFDYSKSAKKPDDIPATPVKTYAESRWAGLDDWLGIERKR